MPELHPTDSVSITLADGKERQLRYSVGSMRRLRKKYGASLMKQETLLSLDEETLPDLILEGLVEKDGLTVDDVAELMDTRRMKQIMEAFQEAFVGSLPEKNETSQMTVQ